ncbi:hypothetical protein [Winogradskyella sp. PE311]|uniref:hypothetical protein n=1 Tax=Winogradskyella sp. PE311 TaxID=3366943 RepID=UPI00397FDC2A
MKTTMHKAAQYLATAAISFIKKKDDDSHTNLGWYNHKLETHAFPNGDKLALNYKDFSLEWIHNKNQEQLSLQGKTHLEITDWISKISQNKGLENSYDYALHYDLPYDDVINSTTYVITNQNALNALIEQRDLAQNVLASILSSNNYESSLRIWPHHFDTGAFFNLNDNLSIGLGMAIPDSVIDDFYFYVSGYNGHDKIDLGKINDLKLGSYFNKDWYGFALPISGINKQTAVDFCNEAINRYRDTL